jgi:predicted phosphoribosyltransferase
MYFRDRKEAGELLAEKLLQYKSDHPLILALPRGGVPVGYEVARALGAPLDVIVARKTGAPSNPEFAIGAIAPGGIFVLDTALVADLGLSKEELDSIIGQETAEMDRRILLYKSGAWSEGEPTSTVIVVDDGLATGMTARAAIESVKDTIAPEKLVYAAPVCAADTAQSLRSEGVEVYCVYEPEHFAAVGMWYKEFEQVKDTEVLDYLERAKHEHKHR